MASIMTTVKESGEVEITRAVNLEDELSLTLDTAKGEIRVNTTLRPSPWEFLL